MGVTDKGYKDRFYGFRFALFTLFDRLVLFYLFLTYNQCIASEIGPGFSLLAVQQDCSRYADAEVRFR
jgi:hypothetical protein